MWDDYQKRTRKIIIWWEKDSFRFKKNQLHFLFHPERNGDETDTVQETHLDTFELSFGARKDCKLWTCCNLFETILSDLCIYETFVQLGAWLNDVGFPQRYNNQSIYIEDLKWT